MGNMTPQTRGEQVFLRYLHEAPMSYALWRSLEYQLLIEQEFKEPLLDLGCGEGLFSSILFEGMSAVGMDLDFEEVKLANRYNVHSGLVTADGCKLPFRDSSFETVFSNCVIEHIPGLEVLLAEVERVLKPGGRFICTVPGERFTPNLYFVRLFSRLGLGFAGRIYGSVVNRMLGHVHQLSNAEWAAKLEESGLRIVKSEPLISAASVRMFDLGIYSAYRSYLNRMFFHSWILFPRIRRWWAPRLFSIARHLLADREDVGGGLMLIGQKKGA